jgi:hypothetical protein
MLPGVEGDERRGAMFCRARGAGIEVRELESRGRTVYSVS